jgi:hypothetical protein
MPVSFRILPQCNLVEVTYVGTVSIGQTRQSMQDYLAHPDFRPGQMQLVDFTRISGLGSDMPEFLAFMAEVAGMLPFELTDHMLVYIAPTPAAREVAMKVARSWDGIAGVTVRIADSRTAALAILGLDRLPVGT